MIGKGRDIEATDLEAMYATICTDGWDAVLAWMDNNLHRRMLELFADGRVNTTPEDVKAMDRLRGCDEFIRDIAGLKISVECQIEELRKAQDVGT